MLVEIPTEEIGKFLEKSKKFTIILTVTVDDKEDGDPEPEKIHPLNEGVDAKKE
jgi:hypothetical protein